MQKLNGREIRIITAEPEELKKMNETIMVEGFVDLSVDQEAKKKKKKEKEMKELKEIKRKKI
jgi:hypothetical protein